MICLLKLTGSLLLIFAGTLLGFTESRKLTVRVESLESFLRFLSAAKTEVRYSAVPVVQIVARHGRELSFLRECVKRCGQGEGFADAWKRAALNSGKGDGFAAHDIELLLSFGEGFGASDTDGQLSHMELFSGLFGTNLKSAREDRNRKSKLYLMLGVFAGLFSALMLC